MPKVRKSEIGNQKSENDILSTPSRRPTRRTFLFILIIGLVLIGFYKKEWFVAAMVNNQPLTTLEVIQRMNALHKERIVTQLINEKLLEQEAAKKGVFVSQKEVDEKITETENQYGGKEKFESLIAQQGITRQELARQTRFQLIVEKLYEKEATVSAEEIQKFMDESSNIPEATEPAKFKKLAEEQLKQQKISGIFNEKFQALKQAAKIQIF